MPARFAVAGFFIEVPMPVPASINDLSTTAASNSPQGSDAALPLMDDYMRAFASFIAQLRDNKLNSSAVSAFMLTLLDDPDAATAQATLGIKRWDTGEWVLSAKTSAPTGTVVPNGGTIGSASSGATTRANADTSDLFSLLWSVTTNTDYPIQDSSGAASTRGASAAADFAANKRMPLPNVQDGDALVAAVSSAVLSRTVGANLSHTHTITVDPVGDHAHSLVQRLNITTFPVSPGTGVAGDAGESSTGNAGAHTHTASAATSGGSKNLAAGLMTKLYLAL